MKRMLFISLVCLLSFEMIFSISAQTQSIDSSPPSNKIVKLIFIHHSTGENWLTDDYGNLGQELSNNNYFVSDTNYGWGPDSIGDRTDIVNWREWFRSRETPRFMEALFSENRQHSNYERSLSDPGGENEIIMFKSCFPNSALLGNPSDSPDLNEDFTVGHAKYVYNDLLNYFNTRPDKLFIVITAPPLQDPTYANNARAFNNWLVYDWLDENDYSLNNVAVFDFYNVLTHPDNHHRVHNGQIEHVSNGANTLYYDSDGDDHPNEAGSQKATQEFIPLLNFYYNRWMENSSGDQTSSRDAAKPTMEMLTPPGNESLPKEEAPVDLPPSDTIDDFEGSLPSGSEGWQPYWDEDTTTEFDCFLQDGSLRINFVIAEESWATCSLFYDNYRDWSQFQGITFRYQANAPELVFDITLHSGTMDEPTNYQYSIVSSEEAQVEWNLIDLTWNQILGVDWETDARNPIDPAQITGVSFGFSAEAGIQNTGTLWIDDLQLLNEDTERAPGEAQSAVEEQPEGESSKNIQTESEAPTGGNVPCPGSTALIGISFAGIIILKRKQI